MDIDLKKLVRISDFKPEDKKKILDNFNTLSGDAILELWQLCLENLQWKLEIEFSKRFHEAILSGVASGKDNTDYKDIEHDILLDLFTKAEVEVRNEEIDDVRALLKNIKSPQSSAQSPTATSTTPFKN